MTDTIRALLEKAEPDARTERDSVGCHIVASCVLYTGQKFFTIDTVCAALSASAAVESVDAELLRLVKLANASVHGTHTIAWQSAARDAIQRAESAQPAAPGVVEPPPDLMSNPVYAACHNAYDHRWHKVRAEVPFDLFYSIWREAMRRINSNWPEDQP